jgi:hypothetical protein
MFVAFALFFSILDMKTFFILGRRGDKISPPASEEKAKLRPTSNPSTPSKVVSLPSQRTHQSLPVSPVQQSTPTKQQTSIPIYTADSLHSYYQRRDRVYSCHVTRPTRPSTYLALTPLETKASSLPSILDSG